MLSIHSFFDFQNFNHIIFSKLLVILLLIQKFMTVNLVMVNFTRMKSNMKR